MMRLEVFKQLTKATYNLAKMDRMMRLVVFKQLTLFTYWLETEERDGVG